MGERLLLSRIITKHVNTVLKNVSGPAIVFYKGITLTEYGILTEHYPPVHQGAYLSEHGVDLVRMRKEAKAILQSVLSLGSGIHIGLYEQLLVLPPLESIRSFYDGKILIVENNLYNKMYPCTITPELRDYVAAYYDFLQDEEDPKEEPEIVKTLSDFYTNVVQSDGHFFVSYRDISSDVDDIHKLQLLLEPDVGLSLSEAVEGLETVTLSPTAPEEILVLKQDMLTANTPLTVNILIDKPIWTEKQLKDDFAAFTDGVAGYHELKFYRKSNRVRPQIDGHYANLLHQYWNTKTFRKFDIYADPDLGKEKISVSQGEIVQTIVSEIEKAVSKESYQDVFVTAPTGAGKSVLYQLPAIHIAETMQLVTIVLSPLKALMKDQVEALKQKGVDYCAYINSDLSPRQKEQILQDVKSGAISILYVSPEFFLAYDIRHLIGDRTLGLLVVDEAHLVTTWGRDFRVDYWYLGTYIEKVRRYTSNSGFVVAAFSATVVYGGDDDMFFETISSLNMRSPKKFLGNTRRENIRFKIRRWKPRSYTEERDEKTSGRIVHYIENNDKAIIYFPYTSQIRHQLDLLPSGEKRHVAHYYGQLDAAIKNDSEESFRYGDANVMLATKAFGMGVDVSDITHVYHHAPTGNLCDYVQEIGRAARDPNITGVAEQDFCESDLRFSRILYGLSAMKQYQLKEMLKKLYGVYTLNKHRNFLMSVDTFSYLFPDDNNVENRVKNGLMLIEKDLERKYGYPVVLVRPKSLFSRAYVVVPQGVEAEVLRSRHGKHFTKISQSTKHRVQSRNFYGSDIEVSDLGPIYEVDLKAIWEHEFRDISFPLLKKQFYDLGLFKYSEPIAPRFRLTVTMTSDSLTGTREKLRQAIESIILSFDELRGSFFDADDFRKEFRKRTTDDLVARKVANLFLHLFSVEMRNGGQFNHDGKFLQKRKKGDGDEYRLIDRSYNNLRRKVLVEYDKLISHKNGDDTELTRFIPMGSDSPFVRTAYILEALSLGSYEIRGGECPEMFVRVNDPAKLKRLSSEHANYSNSILTDVSARRNRSTETMKNFFMEDLIDSERWDFIEEYFLGQI